jgi:alpha-L-arabinofuranosidase
MRRTVIVTVLATGLLAGSTTSYGAEQAAEIRIGTERIAPPVTKHLAGVNHRWPQQGLGMWDAEADRPSADMVDLSKRLDLSMVRYPGGTVANLFRWKRAIGPQAQRQCQTGGGFVGNQQPMDSVYGVEEHFRYTAEIGAQTQIMTSSVQPVQDAADFVEYLNAKVGTNPGGGTAWAAVRAKNGHPAPYGVKLWEVGNELYLGNQVYWRAQDLATRVRQYAFGGTERKTAEPAGLDCDNRDSASISTGAPGQQLKVRWAPAVAGSQTVYVAGQAWQPVADLSKAGPDEQVYEFDPRTGRIEFGDGSHGAVPPQGAQVTADYTSGPHPGFVDYYRAMKKVDPSISVCTAWEKTEWVELMGKRHPYDCIAPHLYGHPVLGGSTAEIHDRWFADPTRDAHAVMVELRDLDAALTKVFGHSKKRPFVAVTEWGVIAEAAGHTPPPGWQNSVSWTLNAAEMLGEMIGHGVAVTDVSNLNREVPALGELFGGAPDFHWTGRANVIKLFTELIGTSPVRVELDGVPTASTGDYQALTAYATRGPGGVTRVVVVNRDREQAHSATVAGAGRGTADVRVLTHNGPDIASVNTPADETVIATTESRKTAPAGSVSHEFEPHSVTLLEIRPSRTAVAAAIAPTQVLPDSVSLADPTVVDFGGRFWAYGTNNPGTGGKIPMYVADDLTGPYSYQGKAIANIGWAKPDSAVFAPDIRHTGGNRFLLYFAATPTWYDNDQKCVGVAVSTAGPGGPFAARPEPLRCVPERGGTIDPSYFLAPSGQTYVLYKTNHALNNPGDPLRELWAIPVSADGLSVTGEPTHLLGRRHNIEHPQLLYQNNTYLLFFSRDLYRSYEYKTSVMRSPTLSGTYTGERAVITTQNSKAAGPGGADVVYVEENDVGWVAFFHGWVKEGSNCYVRRPMWLAELTFGADGLTPALAAPGSGPTPTCP